MINPFNQPNYVGHTTIINPPIITNNNNYANVIYYNQQPEIYHEFPRTDTIPHNIPYTMVPNNNQTYFAPNPRIINNYNYVPTYFTNNYVYNPNPNNIQKNNYFVNNNTATYTIPNNNLNFINKNNNAFIPNKSILIGNEKRISDINTSPGVLTNQNITPKKEIQQFNINSNNNKNLSKSTNPYINNINNNIKKIPIPENIKKNEIIRREQNQNNKNLNISTQIIDKNENISQKTNQTYNNKIEKIKKQNNQTIDTIPKKQLMPTDQTNNNKINNNMVQNDNFKKNQNDSNVNNNQNNIQNKNIPKDNNKKPEVVEVTDGLSKLQIKPKEILKRPLTPEDFKTIYLTGIGMMNLGNTCFINSTLQVLIHCKLFITYFLRKFDNINKESTPISYEFLLICINMLDISKENKKYIDITNFKESFGKKHPIFNGYAQNDSQEFCRIFLEDISTELNEAKNKNVYKTLTNSVGKHKIFRDKEFDMNFKERETSIITYLFYSQIITTFKCTCGSEIYSFQKLLDFPLLLPENIKKIDLKDLLNIYFKTEIVEFETECETCKEKTKHHKITRISRPPEILIISLQRINESNQKKNECLVTFPKLLNLYEFIDHECGYDKESEYILFSFINHQGNMDFGHYYSYIQPLNSKNWYEFNDSMVKHVTTGLTVFPYAYALFYIKKKYLTLNNF